jgi:hypothetical protein
MPFQGSYRSSKRGRALPGETGTRFQVPELQANSEFPLNSLMLDDGTQHNTDSLTGLGAAFIGREQIRQRRAQHMREAQQRGLTSGLNFIRSDGTAINSLPSAWDDAYFGILQAKENLANAAGKRFKVAPNAHDVRPDTRWEAGQESAVGGPSLQALEAVTGGTDTDRMIRKYRTRR